MIVDLLCAFSIGLPGHGGSVSHVSSRRGVSHPRQPCGHAREAANGRWDRKYVLTITKKHNSQSMRRFLESKKMTPVLQVKIFFKSTKAAKVCF